jgi:hypothetical protein
MNKASLLKSFDDLVMTGEILLTHLYDDSDDSGDKPMEAISVMLIQLVRDFGNQKVIMQQLLPAMELIKNRIDGKNFVGAIWDTKDLIKALKEIRSLIAGKN